MPDLRLSDLVVYPLKGGAGVSVTRWPVDSFGPRYDRRWMAVDPGGRMITQRTHPRLAFVRPSFLESSLRLDAPNTPPLQLPLEMPTFRPGDRMIRATIWKDTCDAVWLGTDAAQWLSRVLGSPCGLAYMPDSTIRPADSTYAPAGVRVSFADAYPFLLLSEESLAALNSRLTLPLSMNRFRPNLVIAGGEPHVEDSLREFELGGMTFRPVKPCDRCVVTTTDQETLARGVEPLRTLATYRKVDGGVMFGQNVVHQGTGQLIVGASLLV